MANVAIVVFRLLSQARNPPARDSPPVRKTGRVHATLKSTDFYVRPTNDQSALAYLPVRPQVTGGMSQRRVSPLDWPPPWRSLLSAKLRCDVPELLYRPIADGCRCVSHRVPTANEHIEICMLKMTMHGESSTVHTAFIRKMDSEFQSGTVLAVVTPPLFQPMRRERGQWDVFVSQCRRRWRMFMRRICARNEAHARGVLRMLSVLKHRFKMEQTTRCASAHHPTGAGQSMPVSRRAASDIML